MLRNCQALSYGCRLLISIDKGFKWWSSCRVGSPVLMWRLLLWLESSETDSLAQGWALAMLLGISGFITAVFYHQMMW